MKYHETVEWSERFMVGINLIDEQHKILIDIINALYSGDIRIGEPAESGLLKSIHTAADYVRFHFSTEETLLKVINYPGFSIHKAQHDLFTRRLLWTVQLFDEEKRYVPYVYARHLRTLLLNHITLSDKKFAEYLRFTRRYPPNRLRV